MKSVITAASPELAQTYQLKQAAYHALVCGVETVMKFRPVPATTTSRQQVFFYESILRAAINVETISGTYVRAMIQADYAPLLGQKVTMAFAADKAVIQKAKTIRGEGDVRIRLEDGQYRIQGDHTGARFQAIPMSDAACFTMPVISWLGKELSGYDSKDLSEYFGKGNEAVHLAVYGDQLEQVWVDGADGPYTFTAGMAEHLASRRPGVVLNSLIACRFIGPKQALRLGKVDDRYVLCATTPINMGVDLVVTELLDVVSGS